MTISLIYACSFACALWPASVRGFCSSGIGGIIFLITYIRKYEYTSRLASGPTGRRPAVRPALGCGDRDAPDGMGARKPGWVGLPARDPGAVEGQGRAVDVAVVGAAWRSRSDIWYPRTGAGIEPERSFPTPRNRQRLAEIRSSFIAPRTGESDYFILKHRSYSSQGVPKRCASGSKMRP